MFRRLSLTSRLTIFFIALASSVILGLALLFMVEADRHFVDLDSAALDDKKHLIEGILASSRSHEEARSRLNEALSHHHSLYALVKGPQGEKLYQTNGYSGPTTQASFITNDDGHGLQSWRSGGREFHEMSFTAGMVQGMAGPLQISLAVDTQHHQEFMRELRRSIAIYAVLAILLSGFLAWFAAHQGMSPLRAMKRRAAAVTGQQLQERMPEDAVPIEMADLARELNEMLGRLQNDFKQLADFAADLAHELRTPISNLLTQTQVTLSTQRDLKTYQDTLASNAEELQRLARVVSDMLLLAKTERGVDLPHKESFSAAQEARELVEFYEAVADEKRILMSVEGDGRIYGDRLMFRRALSNLLSNALRHAPVGGVVGVRIESSSRGIEVTVKNTGKEIPLDVQQRVFERFYRADSARRHPASDGAGLGLSITKAIVEAHGGAISVTSDQEWTRFRLVFPGLQARMRQATELLSRP
jgi:two-component system heavy metal sensor histidine kinase CusS